MTDFLLLDGWKTTKVTETSERIRIGRGYTFEVIRAKSIYASMRPNVELFRCPACRGLFEERDMEMVGAVQLNPDQLLPIELRLVCRDCVAFHTERGSTRAQLSTLSSE